MTLSRDQLEDRAAALSASEIAATLGLSPWESPLGLWLRKTGQSQPSPETAAQRWGHKLEPLILADYEERRGVTVQRVGTLTRPTEIVTIAATPDGLLPDRGIEIKRHGHWAADYGREGTDEVPLHEAIQCQIGCWVTGRRQWDLIAWYDGLPHDFSIRRDDQLLERVLEHASRWWRDHVVAHKAPEPDGSKATEAALRAQYPGVTRETPRYRAPTDEEDQLIEELRLTRCRLASERREEARLRQRLEASIGDADGLNWTRAGKALTLSWRPAKPKKEIDYEAVLWDYVGRVALRVEALTSFTDQHGERAEVTSAPVRALRDEVAKGPDLKRYTTSTPGARRFTVPRVWAQQGDDGD